MGISKVCRPATRRPSRRTAAPAILHSLPTETCDRSPCIERRVTRLAVEICGFVEVATVSATVCTSPSLPSWTNFSFPASAMLCGGKAAAFRCASHGQKAGQTSWNRQF